MTSKACVTLFLYDVIIVKTLKVGMFLNKAVYKVGHFIRIVSPATEISYLEAAWSGISMINDRPVEGVVDSMVDLNDYKMHFYTPEKKDGKFFYTIRPNNFLNSTFS